MVIKGWVSLRDGLNCLRKAEKWVSWIGTAGKGIYIKPRCLVSDARHLTVAFSGHQGLHEHDRSAKCKWRYSPSTSRGLPWCGANDLLPNLSARAQKDMTYYANKVFEYVWGIKNTNDVFFPISETLLRLRPIWEAFWHCEGIKGSSEKPFLGWYYLIKS